jgi:hypothetical protein
MATQVTIVSDRSAQVAAALRVSLAEIVRETAKEVQRREIERIVGGSKTGRVYTSGPEPLPHQASAPGESPANWTGELASSIVAQQVGPMEWDVETTSEHAAPLEFGSVKNGGARPFVLPTAEEMKPVFIERVKAGVQEALG